MTRANLARRFVAAALIAATAGCGASPHAGAAAAPPVRITARKYAFSPATVTLRRGVPVTLEVVSADRVHGFFVPDFGIRTNVVPGRVAAVSLVPDRAGTFPFRCDVFCGSGHESMVGEIVVAP